MDGRDRVRRKESICGARLIEKKGGKRERE